MVPAAYDLAMSRNRPPESTTPLTGRLPKLEFPEFDGENTSLWICRAKTYFEMYDADPSVWVKVSTMKFTSPVARWVPSVNCKLKQLSRPDLCRLLHDRFDQDQHESLLWQLYHTRQAGTVQYYIDRFAELHYNDPELP